MDNSKNFYISAIIAFSIYFFVVFVFLYYSKHNNIKKIDAFNKSTVLQLDIIVETKKEDYKKLAIKNNIKNKKIAKKVVKKTVSVSAKQRTNLKSLFANVKTKTRRIVKTKVLNVKQSSIASRFKSKFEKEKKTKNIVLNDLLNNNTKLNKTVISETKNENDPYFSKIYTILSSRWNPTLFFNDLHAKVVITIAYNGTFSYQFIQYSDDIGFDNQLKRFLENESLKIYPINPNKKTTKIEITFRSKGES